MTERLGPVVTDFVIGRKRNGRVIYSRSGKRALVEAALQPGVSVARLALDHAVNANLLRKWIRAYQAEQASSLSPSGKPAVLLPVIATEAPPSAPTACIPPPESLIEIVFAVATVRVRGAVDARQLRTVMDCLAPRA